MRASFNLDYPSVARGLKAKAQLCPRKKLTIEQQRIAMQFEAMIGMCAPSTKMRIKAKFPSIETSPFER